MSGLGLGELTYLINRKIHPSAVQPYRADKPPQGYYLSPRSRTSLAPSPDQL